MQSIYVNFMNLLIDIGNSLAKYYLCSDNDPQIETILEHNSSETLIFSAIKQIYNKYHVKKMIVSAVIVISDKFVANLLNTFPQTIVLGTNTFLPIENLYLSPDTLGNDRKAVAVGANYLYPNSNLLIIDAGTAITYDIVNSKNQYLGGNISVGLSSRFKALNFFTKKLPLLEKPLLEKTYLQKMFGQNTEEAILLGVQNGMKYEIQGYIERFKYLYPNNKIIITGGDGLFLSQRIEYPTVVISNLVSIGLNRILESNV